jgi:uncharacterized membrane-anchored protein
MERVLLEIGFMALALLAFPAAVWAFTLTTKPENLAVAWRFWTIGLSAVAAATAWVFAVGFVRLWLFYGA